MPTGSLSQNTIVASTDGGFYFIPSGSVTVGVSSSTAVAQQYVISMSVFPYTSTSSSILAKPNTTSSYWYFRQPDNYSFKIFYQNTGSTAVESTGSNLYSLPIQSSDSGSVVKVTVHPGISGSHPSASIARVTYNALNVHPKKINRYTVSSSYSGSGTGKREYIHLTNLIPGLPPSDDISFKYISGSEFNYHVPVSGSGDAFGAYNIGTPDTGSASSYLLIDPNDPSSFIMSGSGTTKLYFSGSGQIGIGTTNPERDFDIRSDDFGIRMKTKMAGIRMNADGNIESFNNDTTSAATGSEIILKYTRGTKAAGVEDELVPDDEYYDRAITSAGDILGSIRWVTDSGSLDQRAAGEAGNIKMAVASSTAAGVTGKLSFNLSAAAGDAPQQLYSIDGLTERHEFTGSLFIEDNIYSTRFFQNGSNISTVFSPIAGGSGIVTVGTIGTGVWQGTAITAAYIADNKGTRHYGDTIKILPTDFIQNEDGGVNKSHQLDDTGTFGVRASDTNAELWAFISIPEGQKATHVHIKGLDSGADGSSADDVSIEVFEYSLSAGSTTSKGTGVVGTNLDITDVNATAINCLAIRVDTVDVTGSDTDVVYGGYVTIANQ